MTKHVKTEEHRDNLAKALRISVDALPAPRVFKCMYQYFGCDAEYVILLYYYDIALRHHWQDEVL